MSSKISDNLLSTIGRYLYGFRLFMSVFYIGLAFVVFLFVGKFLKEIYLLTDKVFFGEIQKIEMIIKALEMVDLVMVAQLVWVVSMAGFSLFVTSKHFDGADVEKPDWLDHVNTYNLKLKLAFAIISISGVHTLKTFLEGDKSNEYMIVLAGVHLTFVFCAIGLAYAESIAKKNH